MNNSFVIANQQGRKYDCAPNWQISFLTPAEVILNYDFAENEMGYLGGPPLHVHPYQDETHYVLQGHLRYQIGEQAIEVKRGDCIHIPRSTPHAWINLQSEPARIISILSPGASEGFFKTLVSVSEPLEPEALIQLGQEYGTEVLGPPLATLDDYAVKHSDYP